MKTESHIIKLKEHREGLEWGIKQDNQSSVGFHASQGAVELVSIYLHKLNLIPADIQIKHVWFRSENILKEKLGFDFPHKKEILELMGKIEGLRDPMCYGAPNPEETIRIIAESFCTLKDIIEKELGEKFD